MSIFNNDRQEIRLLEEGTFDKEIDDPTSRLLLNYSEKKEYLNEVIRYEDILNLLRENVENVLEEIFYISTWDKEEGIFEMRFDEDILSDFMNFMYEPFVLPLEKQPLHPFVFTETVYIFNSNRTLAIVSDRYYDVTILFKTLPTSAA